MAGLILAFARVLAIAVDPATVDVRHFSLYPWNGARVLRLAGILALHVAALWAATLVLIAARGVWRLPSRALGTRLTLLLAVGGADRRRQCGRDRAGVAAADRRPAAVAVACCVAALLARRVVVWYRHATIAARIFGLFVTFLVPAVLLYPSLNFFAELAIERLITTYAVEAQNHSATLLGRLERGAATRSTASRQLPDLVSEPTDAASPTGSEERVLRLEPDGARPRPADVGGRAVQRPTARGQPLRVVPAGVHRQRPAAAGSAVVSVGRVRRAACRSDRRSGSCCTPSGRICVGDEPRRSVGTIVLHLAVDDYRTLPFITSQSPYFELFRPSQSERLARSRRRATMCTSRSTAGASSPSTRLVSRPGRSRKRSSSASTILPAGRSGRRSRSARPRIRSTSPTIAPASTPSVIRSSRCSTTWCISPRSARSPARRSCSCCSPPRLFTRLSRERPRVGRALLREIRASFYRKLFLAFVLASIIPVLILALVIRAYFADLLRKDIQGEAARTASVAQRVIEESDALLNRADGVEVPNDDVMVWISQVIDQDVNIFDGPKLVATSERDLFASGLLPTRTPDAVYRAIVLQRLPSFVDEDELGAFALPHRRHAGPHRRRRDRANPDRAGGAPPARHRARDRRSRSRRPPRGAVLHPARRGARPVAGRAHRRSRPPADPRDAAHRARRLRRAHRRALGRRAAPAGRRLQQHGRRAQGAARRARAHAPSGSLGRDGASGGARNQEPA